MFFRERSMTSAGRVLPAAAFSAGVMAVALSAAEAVLSQVTEASWPWSRAVTVSGCSAANFLLTIRMVVGNWPFSQRSFSSTRTLPPAWSTRREAQGSGSHAPSSFPSWKSLRVWAFSVGLTATSPPPFGVVFRPCLPSQARSGTSWGPPSRGVARGVSLGAARGRAGDDADGGTLALDEGVDGRVRAEVRRVDGTGVQGLDRGRSGVE